MRLSLYIYRAPLCIIHIFKEKVLENGSVIVCDCFIPTLFERIGNKFRRNVRCRNRQKDARIVAGSREAGYLLCGHTL